MTQQLNIVYFQFSDPDDVFMKLKQMNQNAVPERGKWTNQLFNRIYLKIRSKAFGVTGNLKKNQFENNLQWWEETKIEITSIAIEVAKQLNVTEKQIREWGKRLDNDTGIDSINNKNKFNNLKVKNKGSCCQKSWLSQN